MLVFWEPCEPVSLGTCLALPFYTQRLPAGPGPPLPRPVTQELVLLARLCVLGSWGWHGACVSLQKSPPTVSGSLLITQPSSREKRKQYQLGLWTRSAEAYKCVRTPTSLRGIKGRAFFVTGSLRCVNAPFTFSFVIPIMPGFHFLWNWSCFILGGGKRAAAPLLGLLVGHVLT